MDVLCSVLESVGSPTRDVGRDQDRVERVSGREADFLDEVTSKTVIHLELVASDRCTTSLGAFCEELPVDFNLGLVCEVSTGRRVGRFLRH